MILDALHKIANHGASLSREEARDVMAEVLRGECTDAQIGALLVAGRGPSLSRSEPDERRLATSPPWSAEQILAERLARGEIDTQDYRQRLDTLRD